MQLRAAPKKHSVGFTLIEVMVALVLIGLTLPALTFRVQSILDNASYMDEKTVAFWVAENTYQEMLLELEFEKKKEARINNNSNNSATRKKKTVRKKKDGTVKFAGIEWFTEIERTEVVTEGITQVNVRVGLQEGVWLADISGFLNE